MHRRCACSYDLSGTPQELGRCPECGRDPAAERPDHNTILGRDLLVSAAPAATLEIAAVIAAAVGSVGTAVYLLVAAAAAAMLWPLFAAGIAVKRHPELHRGYWGPLALFWLAGGASVVCATILTYVVWSFAQGIL